MVISEKNTTVLFCYKYWLRTNFTDDPLANRCFYIFASEYNALYQTHVHSIKKTTNSMETLLLGI